MKAGAVKDTERTLRPNEAPVPTIRRVQLISVARLGGKDFRPVDHEAVRMAHLCALDAREL